MKKVLFILFLFTTVHSLAQPDTSKLVRAFPITDYMVDLPIVGDDTNNIDSIKIVQLKLPVGVTIAEKQLGVLRGMYRDKHADTTTIGVGRCHLIKGDYYYFTINNKKSGVKPRAGDLVYVQLSFVGGNSNKAYPGLVVQLAAHYIGLQNVYEKPLYDRYAVFSRWTKSDEQKLLDSLVADIRFTGDYFLKNSPAVNIKIKAGPRAGRMVLNTMISCTKKDVTDFLEYMIARPRFYAGHEWKVSEVFATWLGEGGPTVVKN